uniref:Ovule protein n=1 Tax=Steinernema glaseri TaxID=37863 RepID=A0A1I7YIR6_9BILA
MPNAYVSAAKKEEKKHFIPPKGTKAKWTWRNFRKHSCNPVLIKKKSYSEPQQCINYPSMYLGSIIEMQHLTT